MLLKYIIYSLCQRFLPYRFYRLPEDQQEIDSQEIVEGNYEDGVNGGLSILYALVCLILGSYNLPSSGESLDIGFGTGLMLKKLANLFPDMKFTGIDLSEEMLKKARGVVGSCPNVELMLLDLYELESYFEDKKFDLITWILGLHHCNTVEDAERAISILLNLLKPGGILFVFDLERPKLQKFARYLSEFNLDVNLAYIQNSYQSQRAAFSYNEVENILSNINVKDYLHFHPFIGTVYQYIFIPAVKRRRKIFRTSCYNESFKFRNELAFLRFLFGLY